MKAIQQHIDDRFALYNTDCVKGMEAVPDCSVHFGIHSPPFSNLYVYSDNVRDMGNCTDDAEFLQSYGYLVRELYRTTVPGRLCSVHCKDLVDYTGRDGRAGMRDFPGDIIRLFEANGWKYHSRVTIWKDPVIEMERTKAQGLLHKQLCADSTYSRQGMPDYLLTFRKWAKETEEKVPVNNGGNPRIRFAEYVGESGPYRTQESNPRQYSIEVWQRYASPVWMDIRPTDVLNVKAAREDEDSKHLCPLQLSVIDRAIELWTNPGEIVCSPFAGIGSEGYSALRRNRRFLGFELKTAYYEQALKNLLEIVEAQRQPTLFGDLLQQENAA